MNITINIYGDIYADLHGCPCPPIDDFEDEDYEDEDFGEYDIENDDESEADECIFGRIKADFSNLDEIARCAPPDVILANAIQMGLELMRLQRKEADTNE